MSERFNVIESANTVYTEYMERGHVNYNICADCSLYVINGDRCDDIVKREPRKARNRDHCEGHMQVVASPQGLFPHLWGVGVDPMIIDPKSTNL